MIKPTQQEIDFKQADINAADGIKRAGLNADSRDPEWQANAFDFLKSFLQCVGPECFMVEEVREMAEKTGFPSPPSNRAWGAVILRAARSGIIEFVCYSKTSNPLAHRTPAATWKKKGI